MTRLVHVIVWFVVAGLAVNVGRLLVSRAAGRNNTGPVVSPAPVRVIPYTIELQDTTRQPGQAPTVVRVTVDALRTDGSNVQHRVYPLVRTASSQRELILGTGEYFLIDDLNHRKWTGKVPIPPARRLRNPATQCLFLFSGGKAMSDEAVIGSEMIGSYRALILKGKELAARTWVVPELTCATVKVTVQNPLGDQFESIATRVISGDPAESLFAIPEDYVEVSADEIIKRPRR